MRVCTHQGTLFLSIVTPVLLLAASMHSSVVTQLGVRSHSSLWAPQQQQQQQQPAGYSRKLLQQLPTAREGNINRLSRLAALAGIDGTVDFQISAATGSRLGFNVLSTNFGANGYLAGLVKGIQNYQGATNRNSAQTSNTVRYTSATGPGSGSTTSRTGSDSVVLAQRAIGPAASSSSSNRDTSRSRSMPSRKDSNSSIGMDSKRHSSSRDSRGGSSRARQPDVLSPPAPSEPLDLDVLLAANLDYSIAGDSAVVLFRDYSLPNLDPVSRRKIDPYSLDYDYGQPHPIPQSAESTTSQAAKLAADEKRASSGGSTSAFATGAAVTARTHSTSSSLRGTVTARQNNDIFSRPGSSLASQTVTPPVPLVQSGADAAGSGSAKQYKLSLFPSVSYGASSAHTKTNSVPSGGGASSSVLSYNSGTLGVINRAESIAVDGCVSIDFC